MTGSGRSSLLTVGSRELFAGTGTADVCVVVRSVTGHRHLRSIAALAAPCPDETTSQLDARLSALVGPVGTSER
jgi:hypothetical protein